eukprot:1166250-Alexandrium_andersonii.AAC.1
MRDGRSVDPMVHIAVRRLVSLRRLNYRQANLQGVLATLVAWYAEDSHRGIRTGPISEQEALARLGDPPDGGECGPVGLPLASLAKFGFSMSPDFQIWFGNVSMFNLLEVPAQQLRPRAFEMFVRNTAIASPGSAKTLGG